MIVELVEYLARAVVTKPDQVTVSESRQTGRVTVDLSVAKDDFGRVIGRNGQTIDAIRTLARVVARRHDVEAVVEVVDPERLPRRG